MHEASRFPRGFVLSAGSICPPPGYVRGPILPNFYVHPWTAVDYATDPEGRLVVVLGTCISVISDGAQERAAPKLLRTLQEGEEIFLATLDFYSGRHVIFYGKVDALRVVSDATNMRSVFYASDGGLVASHAEIVEGGITRDVSRNSLPFRYGYPGNRTPYPHTRLLTANTLYDFGSSQVRRYWPSRPLEEGTAKEAASLVLDYSAVVLRQMAQSYDVKIALTAGLDSRTLLAVALYSGINFETYTYGQGSDTYRDRMFAVDLARSAGVAHTLLPGVALDPALQSCLEEAHYSGHHRNAVASLQTWIEDPIRTTAVTANLLEIGRSFYRGRREKGVRPPTTAESMMEVHHHGMGRSTKDAIVAWDAQEFREIAMSAFQDFIDTTDFVRASRLLDPFDLFYWEHRMSAWHGPAMVERDFYAEPFIPFNSRKIFEIMLGVPQAERDAGAVQLELISLVDNTLLDLPINPVTWPQ